VARLNEGMQEKVGNAESQTFELIEPGWYHMRLRDVNTDGNGSKGPYWTWEFEIVEEPYVGRRQWNNTTLSEKSLWVMKMTFDAFGAPLDADTDDLCGQIVKGQVGVRVIQDGPRKGEKANQVSRLAAADADFALPAGAEAKAAEESIF
jgi:hypothetical protein